MGHTTTEMLFRVYSRYVPNLTRQDGSAMERLLASRLSLANALQDTRGTGGESELAPLSGATAAMPVPKPRGAIARELNDKQARGRALVRIPPGKPPPRYAAHF
jgi:integrase